MGCRKALVCTRLSNGTMFSPYVHCSAPNYASSPWDYVTLCVRVSQTASAAPAVLYGTLPHPPFSTPVSPSLQHTCVTLPSAHLCHPPFGTPVSPSFWHTCVTLPSAHLCHPPFGTPVSPSLRHTCVTLPSAHLCHPPFGTPVSPSLRHTCVTLPSAHLCHPPFSTPVSPSLWHICVRAPQNSGQIWNYRSPTAPLCQCIPEHRSYGSSNTGVLGR